MTTSEQSLRASVEHYKTLCDQLQHALGSRIVIEQAKGVLAERYQLEFDEAFHLLRSFCRANNLKLTETARAIVARQHVAGLSGERRPRTAVS